MPKAWSPSGLSWRAREIRSSSRSHPSLEGVDLRQVEQRGQLGRVEFERTLERLPRLDARTAVKGAAMINHVAEQEPGFGIARVEQDEGAVRLFRLGAPPPEPGPLGLEQEAVPFGEPVAVAPGPVGRLARRHDEGACRQHRRQPIVGQRERVVEFSGVPEGIDRLEVLAEAEGALTGQPGLEGGKRRGGQGGEPGHPFDRTAAAARQQLPDEIVHQFKQVALPSLSRLGPRHGLARGGVQDRGGHQPAAGAHHAAGHVVGRVELAGQGFATEARPRLNGRGDSSSSRGSTAVNSSAPSRAVLSSCTMPSAR